MAKRRDYGPGAVYVRGPSWYGRWYDASGNRVQRKLGRVRTEVSADGLTKVMAEEKLGSCARRPVGSFRSRDA